MKTITKKIKRSEDLFIEFTPDELQQLNIKEGEKFSYHVDGDGIILKKFGTIDVDISQWSREVLEMLVVESVEKDISVNEVICNILEEDLEVKNLNS